MFPSTPFVRAYICTCALVVAASAAEGQSATSLVEEGDVVPGVGLVTRIDNLAVNDQGDWLVEADTDHADSTADSVVLCAAGLYLREGQGLVKPSGAILAGFDSINLDSFGNSGWNFLLDGTPGVEDGLYLNTTLLLQSGTISTAIHFTPGTPYLAFVESKINDEGAILLMANVADAAVPGAEDRALVRLELSGTSITSEEVVVMNGDLLPGQTEPVEDLETSAQGFAFNDLGDVLFVADLAGDEARDHAVYLNESLLAQEGSYCPTGGRVWVNLAQAEVDLNDNRDWVLLGTLDGSVATNRLIIKNGAKFRQTGDVLPFLLPYEITSFGTGPVCIANNGDVLWYGGWNQPNPDIDTGLFVNGDLLVREGVTMVGSRTVDTLRGSQNGYAISPGGRYVIFEAILDDTTEGVFLIDRGAQASTAMRNGSGANPIRYTSTSLPRIGRSWFADVDPTGYPTTVTVCAGYGAPLENVHTYWGEILVDVTTPLLFLSVSLASNHGNYVPNDMAFVGYKIYTQGGVVTNPVIIFNAVTLTIGP